MLDDPMTNFTAFAGMRLFASGTLIDVALAVKAKEAEETGEPILAFDGSGAVVDLDLRGTKAEIAARLARRGDAGTTPTSVRSEAGSTDRPAKARGRPKLGVVAREVTLLPRQWDWLSVQPGGASQALRRLIDEARRADLGPARTKAAREAAYRFLTALAGDLPGFEEALRALFAGDAGGFADRMKAWPADVRNQAMKLATFT
jgi:hypothetical protein